MSMRFLSDISFKGKYLKRVSYIVAILLFCSASILQGQEGAANPFDLVFRLEAEERVAAKAVDASNPFDVIAISPTLLKIRETAKTQPENGFPLRLYGVHGSYKFPIFLLISFFVILLLLLTVMLTFYRSKAIKLLQTITRPLLLPHYFRESRGKPSILKFFIYPFTILSVGLFILFILGRNGFISSSTLATSISFALAVPAFYLLYKSSILRLAGWLFPISKEASMYLVAQRAAYFMMGIFILVIDVFLAFSPENLHSILIYLGYGVIVIFTLQHWFRGVMIFSKYIPDNFFRFFTYLCTTEIAPILILVRTIQLVLGI